MESEMGNLAQYTFKPKDEEIISLLNKKKLNPDFYVQFINEVDVYNFEPFDLPRLSSIQSDEFAWYFFCTPYAKHSNSKRVNRRTSTGYWKLTGKERTIISKRGKELIGSKRVLVFCEQGYAFKKHKAEWVVHEFCSQYNSPHKEDFVICRIERRTYNKPKISTRDDRQPSHHLASKFKNDIVENNFPRVETLQLSGHMNVTSDFRNHVAENNFSRAVPQQLPSHYLHFHSRNHVAENTVQGVEREEFANMSSNYRNHVAENIFPMEELKLLPNQHLAFNSGNHAAEEIFSGVEFQLSHQCLASDHRNHAAENPPPRVECQQLPSHYFNLISDYKSHVAENTYPKDKFQLLPSRHLASHSRNHVAENTFLWVESQHLPSHHLISDFRDQVAKHSVSGEEALLLAQFDILRL